MRYAVNILVFIFLGKGNPVLISSKTISQSGKAYAMAAMVPVDDTPLLSYALAHKSVNSTYTMTASNSDVYPAEGLGDVNMALMNGDPYTSAEQKQRDLFEINDTDWYNVSFEGVYSSSVCHLAMHNDWIQSKGYVTDGIVNMNLPEQGISGPFKITSIKHIIPQKKPVDENPNDEWEYRPVTGLFVHQSNDVWKIKFDDGTELGVTNNHPIYSVSKGDWQHAGHLEIGEEVLAKGGNAKVVSKERDLTIQAVYNLEIKDLHNFLVGDVGVVVHNGCLDWISKLAPDWLNKGAHFNVPIKNGTIEILIVPDNAGGFLLKKWPASAKEADFTEGKEIIEEALKNKDFQFKLTETVKKAIEYAKGNGKAAEFKFLHDALKKKFGL
ncbi:MAG TPA: Hint domain-containing protein [Saprospiraceae bacterium]|nr:Hint domain-containing protein [Saprospiraceae bacterium]